MEIDYNNLNNYIIIDLRDKEKFDKSHLNNALNISFDKLIIYPEKYLSKKNKYLLVCDVGIKSKKTCEILNRMGYCTYSLKNGIKSVNNKQED